MTRVSAAAAPPPTLLFIASRCGSRPKKSSGKTNSSRNVAAATISIWTPFVNPELKTFKAVVADFEKANPKIKVNVVGGINDDKIVAAIRGGNAPDVAQSFP